MVTLDNKATFRRIWEEGWSQRQWAIIDEAVAEHFFDHMSGRPSGLAQGREGVKALMSGYFTAFPDLQFTVERMIAEGEYVAGRWRAHGTHTGPLMGIPPTGKSIAVTGNAIDRFVDGKVVEGWTEFDMLGMLQQLGVVPTL